MRRHSGFKWSNGAATEDLAALAAGYYKVDVIDHADQKVTMEFTLEQPLAMKLDAYEYPNGYNISCYECNNGNASVVVLGGAPPFTVGWSDGPYGAERYNLGPKDYKITATDANGCVGAATTILLRGPERSDWSMSGNPGTTPGPQYIGTPDNKDVVFKSNGQERLRLKGNGDIGIWGADTSAGMLYRDFDGILKIGGGPTLPDLPPDRCASYFTPFWLTHGNHIGSTLCPGVEPPRLGTLTNIPLRIVTNGQERMFLSTEGKVGIGTTLPLSQLHVEGDLLVRGGSDGDILTTHSSSTWPVLWAKKGENGWGLSMDPDGKGHILGNWSDPQALLTFSGARVGINNAAPEASLHVDGDLLVRGSDGNGDLVTSSSGSTGPVFWARNSVTAWGLSIDPSGKGHILGDSTIPYSLLTFTDAKVGIGSDDPEAKLHVNGDLLVRGSDPTIGDIVTSASDSTGPVLWARNYQAAWGLSIDSVGKGHILGDWNNPHPVMTFAYDKVGIGTEDMPSDDYSLFVGKGILTEKVKVTLGANAPIPDLLDGGFRTVLHWSYLCLGAILLLHSPRGCRCGLLC